jgi:hypothetical protein
MEAKTGGFESARATQGYAVAKKKKKFIFQKIHMLHDKTIFAYY